MAIFQVKSWYSGDVVFEAEAESINEVVEAAVRSKEDLSTADLRNTDLRGTELSGADLICADLPDADLRDADLRDADLRRADLRRTDLRRANLRGVDLRRAGLNSADLRRADLRRADLRCADLRGADLSCADLRNADLRRAELIGAYLRGANLRGAHLNWNSHELLSAILLQESEGDIERIKVAGAILCLRDWCWDEFLELRSDPQFSWAMDTMAGYVVDGDEVPKALVNWKSQSSEASGEGGLS